MSPLKVTYVHTKKNFQITGCLGLWSLSTDNRLRTSLCFKDWLAKAVFTFSGVCPIHHSNSKQVTPPLFPLSTHSEGWASAAMLIVWYLAPLAIVCGTKDKHLPSTGPASFSCEFGIRSKRCSIWLSQFLAKRKN